MYGLEHKGGTANTNTGNLAGKAGLYSRKEDGCGRKLWKTGFKACELYRGELRWLNKKNET
jgi:hypothetical protein